MAKYRLIYAYTTYVHVDVEAETGEGALKEAAIVCRSPANFAAPEVQPLPEWVSIDFDRSGPCVEVHKCGADGEPVEGVEPEIEF